MDVSSERKDNLPGTTVPMALLFQATKDTQHDMLEHHKIEISA